MSDPILITAGTNQEFLEKYARPGCVGLAGGQTLLDLAIGHAQRGIDAAGHASKWSHAFLFQGVRADGQPWVIESDLQVHRKHIQLGVQENRVAKYHDQGFYTRLAILDFGITPDQLQRLLVEALDLVANHTRYSLRELVGTMIALSHDALREKENVLARRSSYYCSAFIEHVFRKAGIELAPGVAEKNTTPEDLFRSRRPHAAYILERPAEARAIRKVVVALHGKATRLRRKARAVAGRLRPGRA